MTVFLRVTLSRYTGFTIGDRIDIGAKSLLFRAGDDNVQQNSRPATLEIATTNYSIAKTDRIRSSLQACIGGLAASHDASSFDSNAAGGIPGGWSLNGRSLMLRWDQSRRGNQDSPPNWRWRVFSVWWPVRDYNHQFPGFLPHTSFA